MKITIILKSVYFNSIQTFHIYLNVTAHQNVMSLYHVGNN